MSDDGEKKTNGNGNGADKKASIKLRGVQAVATLRDKSAASEEPADAEKPAGKKKSSKKAPEKKTPEKKAPEKADDGE